MLVDGSARPWSHNQCCPRSPAENAEAEDRGWRIVLVPPGIDRSSSCAVTTPWPRQTMRKKDRNCPGSSA